jgi:hypothetical protein
MTWSQMEQFRELIRKLLKLISSDDRRMEARTAYVVRQSAFGSDGVVADPTIR